jgi:hypothetical protein
VVLVHAAVIGGYLLWQQQSDLDLATSLPPSPSS